MSGSGAASGVGQALVKVVLMNGTSVGDFRLSHTCTVADLKRRIAEADGTAAIQEEAAPDFQLLFLASDDPLSPLVLENGSALSAYWLKEGASIILVRLLFCTQSKGKCRDKHDMQLQARIAGVWRPLTKRNIEAAPAKADRTGKTVRPGQLPHLTNRNIAPSPAKADRTRKTDRPGQLPDLTLLMDDVDRNRYFACTKHKPAERCRSACGPRGSKGAHDWVASDDPGNVAWRDSYRCWRLGKTRGAVGEISDANAKPMQTLKKAAPELATKIESLPALVFDVVEEEPEVPSLLPVDGPAVAAISIDEFPADALVTIRVFRFFEDRADEEQVWEQELQNVNSGSLHWLPVHMEPGMHSAKGAKHGTWFTIHYLQVFAKHFRSAYHMANEGACYGAKTFGSTSAETSTVSGKPLQKGYFWYVSPTSRGSLNNGWQHLCRAGPFDGKLFHGEWSKNGRPFEARALQRLLEAACEA